VLWNRIVVDSSFYNQFSNCGQAREEMLIEASVSQAAIEALNKAILHWLARRDVVPLNLSILLPFENGVTG